MDEWLRDDDEDWVGPTREVESAQWRDFLESKREIDDQARRAKRGREQQARKERREKQARSKKQKQEATTKGGGGAPKKIDEYEELFKELNES